VSDTHTHSRVTETHGGGTLPQQALGLGWNQRAAQPGRGAPRSMEAARALARTRRPQKLLSRRVRVHALQDQPQVGRRRRHAGRRRRPQQLLAAGRVGLHAGAEDHAQAQAVLALVQPGRRGLRVQRGRRSGVGRAPHTQLQQSAHADGGRGHKAACEHHAVQRGGLLQAARGLGGLRQRQLRRRVSERGGCASTKGAYARIGGGSQR
jgi:hypothetical protein